jgi:hypothetical protein
MECVRNGHEIVGLVNLRPPNSLSVQNERADANNNPDKVLLTKLIQASHLKMFDFAEMNRFIPF